MTADITETGKEFSRIAPIGMIVPSLLFPLQFKKHAGSAWIPADGRDISPDCPYAKASGVAKVPDLRGMFLRGLNDFHESPLPPRSDGREDPNGSERAPGSYQEDQFKKHQHKRCVVYADNPRAGYSLTHQPHGDGPHGALSDVTGGADETRPKNIAVFYYIKIE